jgi:hypothetical protein
MMGNFLVVTKGVARWSAILRLLGDRDFDLDGYAIDCMVDLANDVYSKASGAVEVVDGEEGEGCDEEEDEDEDHTRG